MKELSRRGFLKAGAGPITAALAGCTGREDDPTAGIDCGYGDPTTEFTIGVGESLEYHDPAPGAFEGGEEAGEGEIVHEGSRLRIKFNGSFARPIIELYNDSPPLTGYVAGKDGDSRIDRYFQVADGRTEDEVKIRTGLDSPGDWGDTDYQNEHICLE